MHCYYHEDREAVGGCKSCGRGLCRECTVDFPKGLACRGRCEEDVQKLIRLIEHNIEMTGRSQELLRSSRGVRSGNAIFNLVLGALFVLWGLNQEGMWFLTAMGAGFIAYGAYWLFLARRMAQVDRN